MSGECDSLARWWGGRSTELLIIWHLPLRNHLCGTFDLIFSSSLFYITYSLIGGWFHSWTVYGVLNFAAWIELHSRVSYIFYIAVTYICIYTFFDHSINAVFILCLQVYIFVRSTINLVCHTQMIYPLVEGVTIIV